MPSKKRKLSPDGGVEVIKDEEKIEESLRLDGVDPAIFGIFLKYMYAHPSPQGAKVHTSTVTGTSRPAPLNGSQSSSVVSNDANLPTQPGPNVPSLPPVPVLLQQPESVPSPINGWLLAQQLGAVGFMNQTIANIYYSVGRSFTLTPNLIDYVWAHTTPILRTPESDSKPNPAGFVSPPLSKMPLTSSRSAVTQETLPRFCPILNPSPLRRLLIDLLIIFWSSQTTRIVARSPNYQQAWNVLFDKRPDLRRNFIFGLQGPAKVMPVQGYFASEAAASLTEEGGANAAEGGKIIKEEAEE